MGPAAGTSTANGLATRQRVGHTDRIRALASTDPANILVQPVGSNCWRVVDAAAQPDDPTMLLGFIEHTTTGFACTLMASLHERQHAPSMDAAREVFASHCGPISEAPC